MCREVCELVKTFLFPPIAKQLDQTTTTPGIGAATTSMTSISMDENGVDNNTDLDQMSTKDGEGMGGGGVTSLVSSNFLSDMAVVLLKTNKNIYQSTLLILFEGNFKLFKAS